LTTPVIAEEAEERAVPQPRPRAEADGVDRPPPRRRRVVHLSAVVVLVVGLLLTGILSFGAASVHDSNEDRLLNQRVKEASAVLSANVPNVQTPIATAAYLAEATNGNRDAFERFADPLTDEGPFVSLSLWPVRTVAPKPLVVVGKQPEMASLPRPDRSEFLTRAFSAPTFALNNLLSADERRIGLGGTNHASNARFVVYGEIGLPRARRSNLDKDAAFADLAYALYIGDKQNEAQLIASSTGGTVLEGRTASQTTPYGDTKLLLVMAPERELGGDLLARLPWLLGLSGLLLTFAAAALVERLSRRRAQAEELADENAALYASQRSVAQTLQHSLLPGEFAEVDGFEFGARYVAGVEGIDIGGDWYDVVPLSEERVLVVVGDVSGRGLPAATTMASLRYAIRAYAAEGAGPAEILTKLSALVSIPRDGHFATVLCAVIDRVNRTMVLANAGHPQPLLLTDGPARFVATETRAPIGVRMGEPYPEGRTPLPAPATLLLYTDGLVEQRGEHLDVGLERLKVAAERPAESLETLLDNVLRDAIPRGSDDDTALVGVQWRT
jgi:serine phosphatase RsbU (regulator of sigma subunit)